MTEGIQHILRYLFGADRLEEVSIDQLKELVDEYPSFNAGHYLLSKKLQEVNDNTYQQENQRTALYFNNPFWLQWLLQSNGKEQTQETQEMFFFAEEESVPPEAPAETLLYKEELISAAPDQIDTIPAEAHPEAIEISQTTVSIYSDLVEEEINGQPQSEEKEIYHVEQTTEIKESYSSPIQEEFLITPNDIEENSLPETDQPQIMQTEESAEDVRANDNGRDHLHEIQDSQTAICYSSASSEPENAYRETRLESEIEQEIEEKSFPEQTPVENRWAEETGIAEIQDQPENIEADPEENISISEPESLTLQETSPSPEELSSHQYQTEKTEDETHPEREEQQPSEFPHTQPREEFSVVQDVSEMVALSSPLPEDKYEMEEKYKEAVEPVSQINAPETIATPSSPTDLAEKPAADQLTFEPYHTIDYFASQGIRLVLEENPSDRFGKQLKSFTDWLKIMKKLPQITLPEEPNDQADAQIQRIAAKSLEEKDTITETMAEVLVKQEKYDKAIEVYLQLSLLNPTKIAYFAAKIEQIKKEKQ
ncbi:MAG TPA: hypothetical protein VMH01_02280 [Puia sp.]|nr:hypothetical protein [Puia sp.]